MGNYSPVEPDLPKVPDTIPSDISPWLSAAKHALGQHEVAGSRDNQFILDCFKHTGYRAGHDEVPWCAAFICRMLEESGYRSTKSAAAISFASYGTPCELKPGAIVVFTWATGQHHVTFCDHIVDQNFVACLGGNQADSVKLSTYERRYVTAVRWPVR